jgi:Mitochondrial carrier protein
MLVTALPSRMGCGAMLVAGGLAGAGSWLSVYPVDVLKSRIQVSRLACHDALQTSGVLMLLMLVLMYLVQALASIKDVVGLFHRPPAQQIHGSVAGRIVRRRATGRRARACLCVASVPPSQEHL